MNRITWSLALCVLLGCLYGTALAQTSFSPEGEYEVRGWNPGTTPEVAPSYTGTAQIWRNGGSFLFEASIDNERYTGVALFDEPTGMLTIQFNGTDGGGLTLLQYTEGALRGRWVFGESPRHVGYEVWTPKP